MSEERCERFARGHKKGEQLSKTYWYKKYNFFEWITCFLRVKSKRANSQPCIVAVVLLRFGTSFDDLLLVTYYLNLLYNTFLIFLLKHTVHFIHLKHIFSSLFALIKPYIHRLIIPRLTKLFVFLENWTFCCPVLGSRHCTCAYTETVDPACRPSIPHKWYWHGLYGRGQLGSIWYGRGIAPSPFTL